MCMAIPAQVIERLDDQRGVVLQQGARRVVSLELVPDARPGDHVMVHLDRALYTVDAAEAAITLALLDELAAALAAPHP
jgi:hydrogenase expression/formation protein HypC